VYYDTVRESIILKKEKNDRQPEPPYIQLYTHGAAECHTFILPTQQKVFLTLVKIRDDESWNGDLCINKHVRRKVLDKLGIKESTFFKAIKKFVEVNILLKRGRGFYIIEPNIYSRGNWKDVRMLYDKLHPNCPSNPEQEPFVKLYLDDISYLDKLSKTEFDVLLYLFPHYRWRGKTQYVPIYKNLRRDIALRVRTTENYIEEVIRNLVKKDFLYKLDRNTYQLNPFWFGFGRWPLVNKMRLRWDAYKVIKIIEDARRKRQNEKTAK